MLFAKASVREGHSIALNQSLPHNPSLNKLLSRLPKGLKPMDGA